MIVFSNRVELEKRYRKWLEGNSKPDTTIKDCPMNLINFLQVHNLLDEEKVLDYLRRN